jgi:DNA-binding HxlR family transcriptional regulator
MKSLRNSRRIRGSRTGRPIMALLDLLGRRMTLRILWELSRAEAPFTFRALQAAADTNPTVLNQRVKELRAAGLVTRDENGYRLSQAGGELTALLLPLHAWAESRARRRVSNGPRYK